MTRKSGCSCLLTAILLCLFLLSCGGAETDWESVVDFATSVGADQRNDTYDGIHPNAAGMKRMSDAALAVLREDYGKS